MALAEPRKSMKMGRRRALAWGQASALRGSPSPQSFPIKGERETAGRRWGPSIPDRSPGHAFIAIARAGCRRHTKVGKWGWLLETFECNFLPPLCPLDSGFRRNDEVGGRNDEVGRRK